MKNRPCSVWPGLVGLFMTSYNTQTHDLGTRRSPGLSTMDCTICSRRTDLLWTSINVVLYTALLLARQPPTCRAAPWRPHRQLPGGPGLIYRSEVVVAGRIQLV